MARGFRIRAPRREDGPALARLVRANNQLHDLPSDRFTPEIVERDLFGARPYLRGRVAETEDRAGALIGVALWCDGYESAYAARGGYLADLYVEPDWRRRGVARALLSAAANGVREEGGEYLWWVAASANAEARAFYDALGAYREAIDLRALIDPEFDRMAEGADVKL